MLFYTLKITIQFDTVSDALAMSASSKSKPVAKPEADTISGSRIEVG
jgi:hypothetical protein